MDNPSIVPDDKHGNHPKYTTKTRALFVGYPRSVHRGGMAEFPRQGLEIRGVFAPLREITVYKR